MTKITAKILTEDKWNSRKLTREKFGHMVCQASSKYFNDISDVFNSFGLILDGLASVNYDIQILKDNFPELEKKFEVNEIKSNNITNFESTTNSDNQMLFETSYCDELGNIFLDKEKTVIEIQFSMSTGSKQFLFSGSDIFYINTETKERVHIYAD